MRNETSGRFISLVYVSSATQHLDEPEILEILKKARTNNESLGVTGMLLYKDGNFMQALEGPADTVSALTEKIRRDPRHKGFMQLVKRDIQEREFGHWSMAFKNAGSLDAPALPGYSAFLNSSFTDEAFQKEPGAAYKLLRFFKENMR